MTEQTRGPLPARDASFSIVVSGIYKTTDKEGQCMKQWVDLDSMHGGASHCLMCLIVVHPPECAANTYEQCLEMLFLRRRLAIMAMLDELEGTL